MSIPKEIQAYMVMTGMPKAAGRGSYFSAFGSTKKPRMDRKHVEHTNLLYHIPSRSLFSPWKQGGGSSSAYLLVDEHTTLEDFQYSVWWLKEKMLRKHIQVLT